MKKMLPWIVTLLLAISLIAVVAIILFNSIVDDPPKTADAQPVAVKKLNADELVAVTSELKDFKRNLKDPDYVVLLNLAFQLDSKKAKAEFDKVLDIEVKPIINRVVADMSEEDLRGSQGEDTLEAKLLTLINPVLPTGKLVKVEITDFIIQQL
ncbi:flagellar basal body-associated FliL family protein [Paenibacillus protaetiae]|uniref:Flagellar protein FliL n=1 Tax=Paenibacillus protaetiae TaxID=2509456 RepID=A0A4P6F5D2_9BACL|nr:flagellar basal body-associated FliL family protein [Paenibacillus protaetiae]QAY65608.1 flagellar basal body protein FliL [Paenibacillus protaetiae]